MALGLGSPESRWARLSAGWWIESEHGEEYHLRRMGGGPPDDSNSRPGAGSSTERAPTHTFHAFPPGDVAAAVGVSPDTLRRALLLSPQSTRRRSRKPKPNPMVAIGVPLRNGENGIAYISENNMPEMSQNLRTAINEIRLGFEGHENMDFIRQCGSIEPIFQPDSFVSENVVE